MVLRVRTSDWWNTYHKLGRKIEKQHAVPTATDIRKAAILRQQSAYLGGMLGPSSAIRQAHDSMEWIIDYGREKFEAELARRKAQALLGSKR